MLKNRYYPITEEVFECSVLPIIISHNKLPGRPVKISHYNFFCGIWYVLRTGISWRDLPEVYGSWHSIYTRFKRWSENGLFWKLLNKLQQTKKITIDITWVDSTTVALHRHGSGYLKKMDPNQPEAEEKV